MKILLTGATGFIGRRLVSRLVADGHQCAVLSRDPQNSQPIPQASIIAYGSQETADAVINLAGETVAGRWTSDKKRRIRTSRVETTQRLVSEFSAWPTPPHTFLSGSATGIYGDRGDLELSEDSVADPRHSFLSEVCLEWEAAANEAAKLGTRVVNLRTSNVLQADGGMLGKMVPPLRLSPVIVPFAPKAYVPWISMEDEIEMIVFALHNASISGPLNLVSPHPATSLELHQALGQALHRKVAGSVPNAASELTLGEFSQALLASSRVLPRKALAAGFQFKHPSLAPFLLEELKR